MIKFFWRILGLLWREVPNILFWGTGFLYISRKIGEQNGLKFRVILLIVITVGVFIIIKWIRRNRRKIIENYSYSVLEDQLKDKQRNDGNNRVDVIVREIPSQKEFEKIYKYARSQSTKYGSDAELVSLLYYLKVDKSNIIRKSAQLFYFSKLRGEHITAYLPKRGAETIEEKDGSFKRERDICEFSDWRAALKTSAEACSKEIEKSEALDLQLSSMSDGEIRFTFYFETNNGNRKWQKHFTFSRDGVLVDESGSVIKSFKNK